MNFFQRLWAKITGKPVDYWYCPSKFKSQMKTCMARAEKALGRKYKGSRIDVQAVAGTKRFRTSKTETGWMWCKFVKGTVYGDVWAGALCFPHSTKHQTIVLYTDPEGKETDFEAAHECGEAILASHGYKGDSHAVLQGVGLAKLTGSENEAVA